MSPHQSRIPGASPQQKFLMCVPAPQGSFITLLSIIFFQNFDRTLAETWSFFPKTKFKALLIFNFSRKVSCSHQNEEFLDQIQLTWQFFHIMIEILMFFLKCWFFKQKLLSLEIFEAPSAPKKCLASLFKDFSKGLFQCLGTTLLAEDSLQQHLWWISKIQK